MCLLVGSDFPETAQDFVFTAVPTHPAVQTVALRPRQHQIIECVERMRVSLPPHMPHSIFQVPEPCNHGATSFICKVRSSSASHIGRPSSIVCKMCSSFRTFSPRKKPFSNTVFTVESEFRRVRSSCRQSHVSQSLPRTAASVLSLQCRC